MAWKLSAARWPSCKCHRRRANAARSYGNRGRAAAPAPAPAPASAVAAASAGAPMPPRGAAAPMPMGTPAGASVPPRNVVPASAAVPSAQRLEAVRPGPLRPAAAGRPAASRCRRSRRWMPGCRAARPCSNPLWCPIARCHARLAARRSAPSRPARLPNWRLARPSRPGGRRGPALFRVDPGPRGSSFCAPRRSRPSCCGRSRPGPGLRAGAAGLRCAFRRSRPPHALAVFPLRHFPKLKRPAPRMLSALAFS